jgi:hypothetical protein
MSIIVIAVLLVFYLMNLTSVHFVMSNHVIHILSRRALWEFQKKQSQESFDKKACMHSMLCS